MNPPAPQHPHQHPPHPPQPSATRPWLPRWRALAWVFGLALALAGPAQAKRVALLVGNASYTVGRLTNPPNDVAEMEKALNALGFEVQKVLNANQNQMKRAVRDFGTAAQGAEVALVYYSGHATQAQGENYLLPVGASIEKESDYPIEAVAANDVLAQIRGAQPKAAILVLDACRDNPLAATTKSTTKGLGRMTPPTGSLIAFATQPENVASDNGHYARVLARELQKPGLELLDVFRNTSAEVKRLSGGKQEPRISEVSINERLYLAGQGGGDPEQEAWDIAKRRDTVVAYEGFLAVFPNGRLAASARSALAGLKPSPAPGGQVFRDCEQAQCPEMVVIPAGRFAMGSPATETRRSDDEGPTRSVNISRFALGKYEVTQGQWKAVMGSNPSRFNSCGDNCPVEQVSWDDIQQYLAKLNQLTGNRYGYRLASEAEWEYAARAGCSTAFNVGGQCRDKIEASEANLDGNYTYNGSAEGVYRQKTLPVGSFQPNTYGLHDMHGNVWEWVQDVWHDNYAYAGAPTDGSAWTTGGDPSRRVLRGGSWFDLPVNLRSANRLRSTPDIRGVDFGFRLARTVP